MTHFTEDGGESRQAERPADELAPVISLFGGQVIVAAAQASRAPEAEPGDQWHRTWTVDEQTETAPGDAPSTGDGVADIAELAAKQLLRKLRTRSLSVSEARNVLVQHDLPHERVESIVDEFLRHGYLDDAALAEQLVHVGIDRKGQGRQVIAQTLSQRGVPRDVADAALSLLPDDEAERALEFARSRVTRLGDVDDTTALRRLLGQLMRRGYGGSAATTAARTALAERGGSSSSVRFR